MRCHAEFDPVKLLRDLLVYRAIQNFSIGIPHILTGQLSHGNCTLEWLFQPDFNRPEDLLDLCVCGLIVDSGQGQEASDLEIRLVKCSARSTNERRIAFGIW